MNTPNALLISQTCDRLKGRWGLAIGTFLIQMIILSAAGSIHATGNVASLIIGGPFALGTAFFSLAIARNKEARLEMIFKGFNHFTTALAAYLLMVLYAVLWSLLLIVPGIIAALSYALTFYIIADDPDIKAKDALKRSKAMMDGHKLKLFYLCLRFFLLALLCILTLGIGFLWLIPLVNVTMAGFYEDVKGK